MESIHSKGGDGDWERWRELKCGLNEAYKSEEEFWCRKARVSWLGKGDRNTRYFHVVTVKKSKRSRIDSLKVEDGNEYSGEKEIAGEVAKYFESLFLIDHPNECNELLEGIPRTVTKLINRNLTRSVESQKIKKTLFSMNPYKTPWQMVCLFFSSKNINMLLDMIYMQL